MNAIGDNGAVAMSEVLKTNSALTELYLYSKFQVFCDIIIILKSFIFVLFKNKRQWDQSSRCKIVERSTQNQQIIEETQPWLFESLPIRIIKDYFGNFDMTVNKIGEQGTKAICEAIEINTTIVQLNLESSDSKTTSHHKQLFHWLYSLFQTNQSVVLEA